MDLSRNLGGVMGKRWECPNCGSPYRTNVSALEAECRGCGRQLYAAHETWALMGGLAVIAVFAYGFAWWALNPPPAEGQSKGDLVGVATVVDGDTIEIRGTRIRIQGYDTPERDKRCGSVNVYQKAS